jgi:hypothetical protein
LPDIFAFLAAFIPAGVYGYSLPRTIGISILLER